MAEMFLRLGIFEHEANPTHGIAEEKFLIQRGETIGGGRFLRLIIGTCHKAKLMALAQSATALALGPIIPTHILKSGIKARILMGRGLMRGGVKGLRPIAKGIGQHPALACRRRIRRRCILRGGLFARLR